jgi:NitT/TauT family transport system substrate-binding protein
MSGQVPAIEFFIMAKPGLEAGAKDTRAELRTLLLADHGLELYGNGIVATEETIVKSPDLLKRFVRAALRGWTFAMANPEKAAEDQIKYVPSLKPDVAVAEIKVVADLAVTDAVRKGGLGSFDPAKMAENVDFVAKYIGLPGPAPAAADVYAMGYLPTSPVLP